MTSTTASSPLAAPRLERSRDGRIVAGVASGIARHLNLDPTLVRIGFAVAVVAGGFGVLAYVAAALLVPEEGADRPILHAGSPRPARTVAGVVLLIVGALTALDGLVDGHVLDRFFWTLVLLGAGAWLVLRAPGENAPVSTPPPTPSGPDAPTVVAPPPAAPRRRSGTRLVAGVMLLVAGGLSAILAATGADLDWQEVAGIAVIAAGATLAVGAFLDASPWLALPPLLLAGAVAGLAAAGVKLEGPMGERHHAPALAADLPQEYRMAIGELDLDLSGTRFAPGSTTELRAQLGMGELHVRVPPDVEVRVTGDVGAGEIKFPGGSTDGTDMQRSELLEGPAGAPVLILEADLGFGELRVEREEAR